MPAVRAGDEYEPSARIDTDPDRRVTDRNGLDDLPARKRDHTDRVVALISDERQGFVVRCRSICRDVRDAQELSTGIRIFDMGNSGDLLDDNKLIVLLEPVIPVSFDN